MSFLINVNLYVFKKSNDLYLYFVIQIKSKIDPNHCFFFFPMASTCLARATLTSQQKNHISGQSNLINSEF